MTLAELKQLTPGLNDKSHSEKIKLFAWFIHSQKNKPEFSPGNLKTCYEELHLDPPQSFGGYLTNLARSKDVLKTAGGYKLSASSRDAFAALYVPVSAKVQVKQLLLDLPGQIPDLAERTYLNEALICYENGAFRATVVMTWNLAYHHLCHHILRKRLNDFNARWLQTFPGHHKKGNRAIVTMDDFNSELKESEVLTICRDAGIIIKDVYRILDEKLGKRNSAAHPSSIAIGQLQVDAYVDDLVKNVVLKIQ
jgi:hypothetical protein